jgi:acetyl-CoA carboxylase biotin carboxylase subunit
MSNILFRKVLVANRGEIAIRVMRTCRELGIATVAIYSEADRGALHVRLADEAHCVGEAPSSRSYLNQERILAVAAETGAEAIHPGYGFLSENADFADACTARGIVFIGPSGASIRAMGDKTSAKTLMTAAGVPTAPGTNDAVEDVDVARRVADEVGYPVLIKAAAGGGGKGMRVVESPADLERSMQMAQSEALSAFGDGRVFIEKYIQEPRHIEFQILADAHGNTVHFFERECSIQRRHQKVVEEAPSSVLTPEIRQQMGEAAVMAARAVDYVGAGTVEFLVDRDLNFYFMEMNTRLQVEHPVTEWITGVDLVAEQLRIAAGEVLGYDQGALAINGHAIECRVYAEDPSGGFLPAPGPLLRHHAPAGFGVRVDAGVEEGGTVEIHYDPMISKLTTWGRTRAEAIRRMERALDEYEIAGVPTTIPFCRFVMGHEAFRDGRFSTHFVQEHFTPAALEDENDERAIAAAIAAVKQLRESAPAAGATDGLNPNGTSRWLARRWAR